MSTDDQPSELYDVPTTDLLEELSKRHRSLLVLGEPLNDPETMCDYYYGSGVWMIGAMSLAGSRLGATLLTRRKELGDEEVEGV